MEPTIQELRDKKAQLVEKAELVQEMASDAGRDLTDEEEKRITAYLDDAEKASAEIEAAEKASQESARRQERIASLRDSRGRQSTPDAPAPNHKTKTNDSKLQLEDDPNKGWRNPRAFFSDVMFESQGRRNLVANPEGLQLLKSAAVGSDEQGNYDDAYGGYLVPEGFSTGVLSTGIEADPISGRTRDIPMASPIINLPYRVDKTHTSSVSGGLSVGRSAETVAKTASRMEVAKLKLEAHSMFGLAYATEELLRDSPVSVAALLASGFSDEFTSALINELINGTGVGQYLGVLNSGALVTVGAETGQTADTINYTNVVKMRSRCWGYQQAIWLANHDTYPQLAQMAADIGTGGSLVWQPSIQEDRPDMLLGRPIFFSEYCDTLGDKGDLILANWNEYLTGTYQPLQSAESVHVRFSNHERAFKVWLRNAGSPWWDTALTTKNSSNTLSPFVTLAARA